MRVLCGGRIAEQRKTDDISSGAAMDIQMVTQYARHMILEWGMSERLGFVNYAGADTREMFIPEKDYSDDTARVIDEEVKTLIDSAYSEAQRLLDQNWDKCVSIAEALLKYETLQGEDVKRLMRGENLGKPTVSELLQAAANAAHGKTAAPESNRPAPGGKEPDFGGAGEGVMPSPA
jgi:cell division protease FtsH